MGKASEMANTATLQPLEQQNPSFSVQNQAERDAGERIWLLTEAEYSSRILMVRFAGNSAWRKGVAITRKNSETFALELVTAGNLHFVQDGKDYIVEPGSVFIIRRGSDQLYEPGPAGFVHKRFIRLDGPLLDAIIGELGLEQCDVCSLSHPAAFTALHKRAIMLIRDHPENYLTRLSLLAFEMLLFVKNDISGSLYPASVSAVIEYMRHNVHRKITIAELSGVAGVSSTQFFRLFKSACNETPLTYFNTLKIRHAAELLTHTLMPIKEIAFSLGYEEHAYFTNQFRKMMGMSPRKYRKKK